MHYEIYSNITVNPLYFDIRYNKNRCNHNLNGTIPQLEMKRIIADIKEYCI